MFQEELFGHSQSDSSPTNEVSLSDRFDIEIAWETAKPIPGEDDAIWREDEYGSRICRREYSNPTSSYGWVAIQPIGSYQPQAVHVANK
ncbi:MAG: hypothetical protein AAF226_00700 [Verrucomicrobiota bacterium]